MFTIINNVRIGGVSRGKTSHIVVADSKVVAVLDGDASVDRAYVALAQKHIDADGMYALPGLIDTHTHPLGAAGEDGPDTRAPEIPMEAFLKSGITSIIGMLGADDFSRTVAALLSRIRALRSQGMSAYCLTGSYRYPPASLGVTTAWDLFFIPEIIGIGEIAISDVRSSAPSDHELRRLVQESRTAARSAGKKGAVLFHVGDEDSGLDPIFRLLESSKIDPSLIIATHLNRNLRLLSQVPQAAQAGIWCDLTAIEFETFPPGFHRAEEALAELLYNHPELEDRITVTSDCGTFVDGITATSPASLYRAFCRSASNPDVGLERATKIFMENPARCFGLVGKGVIQIGADADLILASENFEIEHLFCQGRHVIEDRKLLCSERLLREY